MKSLLKVMLILGGLFALTFVAGRLLGVLTVENVQALLEWAQRVDPAIVFGLVVLLLFADLFVAVPTLTITILAGVLIGFPAGAAAAITGMSLAAGTGYWISRVWGQKGVALLVKDADERASLTAIFQESGPVMILLSRAAPIIPEVTACMAGATRMPFATRRADRNADTNARDTPRFAIATEDFLR
ncbi:VTT domain-containing protein [Sulfitobacter sp. G21635-S1]|uniref:VTT domain-containing protein n=1 Tax=Sulfitobacter sp. G21635-S1 TaxID=3014043 RepID=UPI0022AF89B6|nr:VTT domain-containing protein [Sulfitobacter sp. G21635-S1]MCZ4256521.1 VTT domain-containing protein [Sulfitobacter sp. G21635-S1]